MSTVDRGMIEAAVDGLARRALTARMTDEQAWAVLYDMGFTSVGVSEAAGGTGGSLVEAATVITTLARHTLAIPVAERLVAGRIAAAAGLALPHGMASVVIDDPAALTMGRHGEITGIAHRVPYARSALALVLLGRAGDDRVIAVADRSGYDVSPGVNLAGEPRDDVALRATPAHSVVVDPHAWDELRALARFVRGLQIQGALETVLRLTIDHVRSRRQFGRPVAEFQAVKHQLAALAAEVAATQAANEGALVRVDHGRATFELLAARLRCSLAATTGARIAHQLHGAIGTTLEHPLHRHTTRLWSWREELGDEGTLAQEIAALVDQAGPGGLWPLLTGTAQEPQAASSPP